MRTHRLFQPVLDSMPVRIAPSAVVLSAPTLVAPSTTVSIPVAISMDSGEDSGTASPIIIAPVTTSSTLLC